MMINYDDLFASFTIMWKGMLGLFVICGFIMLLIMAISRIARGSGEESTTSP